MTKVRRHGLPLLVLGAALLLPAPALATTQSASAGAVTATFTFHGKLPQFHGETLTISRSGRTIYRQRVTSPRCGGGCWPVASGSSSLHVLDLGRTGEPNVVLDLYTGGAHCCELAQVFAFDAAHGTYVKTERNFGDYGDSLRDLRHNRRYEFVSGDDAFAYAFTSYAASGLPIQIFTFGHGRFHDVTRSYPRLIRRDASSWWRVFRHNLRDGEGVLAAWAADQELLGHRRLVARTLIRELHRGHLRSADPALPAGRRYIRALNRLLDRLGYVR